MAHAVCVCLLQVAAQNGVSVTLVDVSEDLLTKGRERIETSLKRVVKKKFADDAKVWLCMLTHRGTCAYMYACACMWHLFCAICAARAVITGLLLQVC